MLPKIDFNMMEKNRERGKKDKSQAQNKKYEI